MARGAVRVEHSVTIRRPVDEVFAYLIDLERMPEWQATTSDVRKETDGPVRVGTRFTESRRLLGRSLRSTLEVIALEPDRRFDVRAVTGPVPFEARHTLTPIDGSTRLDFVGEGETKGFFRFGERMLRRVAEREAAQHLATLKRVLERRS